MGSFVTTPEPEAHKILEYVFRVASLVTLSRRKKGNKKDTICKVV